MEQAVAAGTFVPDMSSAHELAPAVPGIGKGALGPAEPEVLPGLTEDLSHLLTMQAVTDEDVYAVVVRHIAPLPVLRHTLSVWCQRLPMGDLRSAAEDILLVLLPVHLCTKISGRQVCSSPADPDFVPQVLVPRLLPLVPLPLMSCGPLSSSWASAFDITHLEILSFGLDEVARWDWRSASAACVSFAPLPAGLSSAFSPPSCSLKDMRQLRAWVCGFLAALGPPLKLAHAGRPVCLRFPFSPGTIEPLSGWLLGMTRTELIENELSETSNAETAALLSAISVAFPLPPSAPPRPALQSLEAFEALSIQSRLALLRSVPATRVVCELLNEVL
ncbi:hypothetical protein AK812_SmicGene10661 [Symbiodinium microadriaticum]|uniref:Uncharacterized protein n=1 Tax=Symbiodinium microadriaticum TaxID=2951 RepID=A0A1Q9EF75_SYMMI|nr:hypothetical protein AK812_SmicGene10661 [Symbiodinium microadriaticum]